ncbi:hypothetical protein [Leuconostoc citreum]
MVHYNETTPHLHYTFVPVVFDTKKALIKVTNQSLTKVDSVEKQIDDFKQVLSKNLFGKTVIKPDDLDTFKSVLANMKKNVKPT